MIFTVTKEEWDTGVALTDAYNEALQKLNKHNLRIAEQYGYDPKKVEVYDFTKRQLSATPRPSGEASRLPDEGEGNA